MNRYEDEFLLISAIQHFMYCPRQFGLIHLEKFWQENYFTRDGKHLHKRVDLPGNRRSSGRRVEYALPLSCREHGITGIADAVEFTDGNAAAPVEYKRGGAEATECDALQLCAQVLCLEEMMRIEIPRAWIFYFESRSRKEIAITHELRSNCIAVIAACHELLRSGVVPQVERSAKCRACSLVEYCMPPQKLRSYRDDFERILEAAP